MNETTHPTDDLAIEAAKKLSQAEFEAILAAKPVFVTDEVEADDKAETVH